jgi:hypothetical protein
MVKKRKTKRQSLINQKEEEIVGKEVKDINSRGELTKKHAVERKRLKVEVKELKRIRFFIFFFTYTWFVCCV